MFPPAVMRPLLRALLFACSLVAPPLGAQDASVGITPFFS